jgi:hypothetical protein
MVLLYPEAGTVSRERECSVPGACPFVGAPVW